MPKGRWLVILSGLAVLAIGAALIGISVQIVEQRAQARYQRAALCQAQDASNEALRAVLSLARAYSETRAIQPAEHRRLQRFYDRALELAPDLDCGPEGVAEGEGD